MTTGIGNEGQPITRLTNRRNIRDEHTCTRLKFTKGFKVSLKFWFCPEFTIVTLVKKRKYSYILSVKKGFSPWITPVNL